MHIGYAHMTMSLNASSSAIQKKIHTEEIVHATTSHKCTCFSVIIINLIFKIKNFGQSKL